MNSIFENLIAVDYFEASGEGQIIENLKKNIVEKKLRVEFTLPAMIFDVTRKLQNKKRKEERAIKEDIKWKTFYSSYTQNLDLQEELLDLIKPLNIQNMIDNVNTIHKMKLEHHHEMYANYKEEQLKCLEESNNKSEVYEYRLVQKKYNAKVNALQLLKNKLRERQNQFKNDKIIVNRNQQHFIIEMLQDFSQRNFLTNKAIEINNHIKMQTDNIAKLKITEASYVAKHQTLKNELKNLKIMKNKRLCQQPKKMQLIQLDNNPDASQLIPTSESAIKTMKLFHINKDRDTRDNQLATHTKVNDVKSFKIPKMSVKSFKKSSKNVIIQPTQNELIKQNQQRLLNRPTNDGRAESHLNPSKSMILQNQQKPQQLKQKEQQTKSELINSNKCELLLQKQKNVYDRNENLNQQTQIKKKKFNENLNKFNNMLKTPKSAHNVTFNEKVEFFETSANEIIEDDIQSNYMETVPRPTTANNKNENEEENIGMNKKLNYFNSLSQNQRKNNNNNTIFNMDIGDNSNEDDDDDDDDVSIDFDGDNNEKFAFNFMEHINNDDNNNNNININKNNALNVEGNQNENFFFSSPKKNKQFDFEFSSNKNNSDEAEYSGTDFFFK